MRVILDIEADSLAPTKIWCIVCKDIDTGELFVFRNLQGWEETQSFLTFAEGVDLWIGHNILDYDLPAISLLVDGFAHPPIEAVLDTLILSKLVDYPRQGHGIADYGEEFGLLKIDFSNFSSFSKELEEYCIRDVEINYKIYLKYLKVLKDPLWIPSILMEHKFQLVCSNLRNKGFFFNTTKANLLLTEVTTELLKLDTDILEAFKPREVLIKEFTPKATKFGTISKTSVPRSLWENIAEYTVGETYRHTRLQEFNPSSHGQIIKVLNEAGWQPINKTQTHINTEREINRLKYGKSGTTSLSLEELNVKLIGLKKTGWKVDEDNLATLPDAAPLAASLLAKRILYESRRRTLTEWLDLVQADGRIHGKFIGLGAWTHRMAHREPNTANIPTAEEMSGATKLLGKELRQLWCAPKKRLLVGVDAEGIQLRIFAHYINDPEFTYALVHGRKEDKTDPHNLNKRILGSVCKTRQAAKRFIFALLLGAGVGKLSSILECDVQETNQALDRLLERYTGFARLKQSVIPNDAKKGWFLGLDGRKVRLPGETAGERKHLAMSGYLQNGESIVIKNAGIKATERMPEEYNSFVVDIVHDEFVIETPNDAFIAEKVKRLFCDCIAEVGQDLNLKCPLAGDGDIGLNWYAIH